MDTEVHHDTASSEKRDRQSTEEAIIAAFDRLFFRDGVHGLGVNAVAQEAGVNKVLIYRYFGDLPGLALRWASNSDFWPDELELIGHSPEDFGKLAVEDRIRIVLLNYMDSVRTRPRTIEMLAAEMVSPNDLTKALTGGIVRPGKAVADYIRLEPGQEHLFERAWKLIFVVNALTAYMCIRARNNPEYMGQDLNNDEAWEFLRDTVSEMSEHLLKS